MCTKNLLQKLLEQAPLLDCKIFPPCFSFRGDEKICELLSLDEVL